MKFQDMVVAQYLLCIKVLVFVKNVKMFETFFGLILRICQIEDYRPITVFCHTL